MTVAVIEFETEKGYDFLNIGSGTEATAESKLASLSGIVKIRRITTLVADAWLQMTSDSSGRATGFVLELGQVVDIEGKYVGM